MKMYTFECDAHVTVEADSEAEAQQKLRTALYKQDEDVDYGGAMVYVTFPEDGVELVDTYDPDDSADWADPDAPDDPDDWAVWDDPDAGDDDV